jgi:hypothetical protein
VPWLFADQNKHYEAKLAVIEQPTGPPAAALAAMAAALAVVLMAPIAVVWFVAMKVPVIVVLMSVPVHPENSSHSFDISKNKIYLNYVKRYLIDERFEGGSHENIEPDRYAIELGEHALGCQKRGSSNHLVRMTKSVPLPVSTLTG